MLELSVAKGAMQHIKDTGPDKILTNLGVSPETLDLVTGTIAWTANQRMDVMRCMDALNHGVCDIVGIPRIALPAEYIAASIAKFVHPVNTMVCCQWSEVRAGVMELAGGNNKQIEHEEITSGKLFSLVLMLQDNIGQDYQNAAFKAAVQTELDKFMGANEGAAV